MISLEDRTVSLFLVSSPHACGDDIPGLAVAFHGAEGKKQWSPLWG